MLATSNWVYVHRACKLHTLTSDYKQPIIDINIRLSCALFLVLWYVLSHVPCVLCLASYVLGTLSCILCHKTHSCVVCALVPWVLHPMFVVLCRVPWWFSLVSGVSCPILCPFLYHVSLCPVSFALILNHVACVQCSVSRSFCKNSLNISW